MRDLEEEVNKVAEGKLYTAQFHREQARFRVLNFPRVLGFGVRTDADRRLKQLSVHQASSSRRR